MGELLPFLHRAREDGGWTPAERARLEALADTFGGGGGDGGRGGLELVFGASDAGDPWCAVKDGHDEVLVHVARIGDRFVAHFPQDDRIAEGRDLYSTLRAWLKSHEESVVVAFNPGGRGQSLIALLLAVMALEREVPPQSPRAAPASAPAEPGPAAGADATPEAQQDEGLAAFARGQDQALGLEPLGAPAARGPPPGGGGAAEPGASGAPRAALAAPLGRESAAPGGGADDAPIEVAEIRGTDAGDRLTGGPGGERMLGGGGNDTLSGRGGPDTLEGGQGDDRIELTGEAVAVGGRGADIFVVQAPASLDRPDTPLGVVKGFHPEEGDRLVTAEGRVIVVMRNEGFGLAQADGDDLRVQIDLDQNGMADGFVLIRAEPARAPFEFGGLLTGSQPAAEWLGI